MTRRRPPARRPDLGRPSVSRAPRPPSVLPSRRNLETCFPFFTHHALALQILATPPLTRWLACSLVLGRRGVGERRWSRGGEESAVEQLPLACRHAGGAAGSCWRIRMEHRIPDATPVPRLTLHTGSCDSQRMGELEGNSPGAGVGTCRPGFPCTLRPLVGPAHALDSQLNEMHA